MIFNFQTHFRKKPRVSILCRINNSPQPLHDVMHIMQCIGYYKRADYFIYQIQTDVSNYSTFEQYNEGSNIHKRHFHSFIIDISFF